MTKCKTCGQEHWEDAVEKITEAQAERDHWRAQAERLEKERDELAGIIRIAAPLYWVANGSMDGAQWWEKEATAALARIAAKGDL